MNLKKASLILSLLILTLISCQKEVDPYTLSDEQLINLMADVHVSEAASVQLPLAIRDSMTEVYLAQILEIHEVEKTRFETNFDRLRKDPKKLEKVYAKVISRLNELKLKKNKEKDNKQKDNKNTIQQKKKR